MELIIFLRLLIAHMLSDFCWQPDSWAANKLKLNVPSYGFYLHLAVTGLTTLAALGNYTEWFYLASIIFVHALIDYVKLRFGKGLKAFLVYELAHIIVFWVVASMVDDDFMKDKAAYINHSWYTVNHGIPLLDAAIELLYTQKVLAIIAGYIFVIWPAGALIKLFTVRWRAEIATANNRDQSGSNDNDSLTNAGFYIGALERSLVLTFFIINQFEAIGFLLAAKSILRFPNLKASKITEYVLIGTMASIGLAITAGLLIGFVVI